VHAVLGRHRPDDRRTGWISGLEEQEGSEHPTAGGLRIGKVMNERCRGTPLMNDWSGTGTASIITTSRNGCMPLTG
jgi:hypothetical protein